MKRNSSTSGRLKGVYLRGKKYWYRYSYEERKRLKESSIESYGMIIRGFCAWLVGENKLRENPAAFIKTRISTSAKERRFCR